MKKIFALLMFTVMLFTANISFAKYADKYERKYPDRVQTIKSDEINLRGSAVKYYYVYLKNNISLTVCEEKTGEKTCLLEYIYIGDEPKQYTEFRYADGKIPYGIDIEHEVVSIKFGDKIVENYAVELDLRNMKDVWYLAGIKKDGKIDYLIGKNSPELSKFRIAIAEAKCIIFH